MASKIKYLVIHCTATRAGQNISSDQLRQWHLGPCKNPDNTVTFMGQVYPALSGISPQMVGGVSVYKIAGRGWKQVGYSDMIHLNGQIENLVPYNNDDTIDKWEITNGQPGINYLSRHIVYVGGLSADGKKAEDTRTEMQHAVLEGYVKKMIELFPTIKVAGHNQFQKKDCPSFSVVQWALAKGIDKKNIYDKWPS
jgi:N-acetylmuramoyl-L-alanine amidase